MKKYLYNKYYDARLFFEFDIGDIDRELLLETVGHQSNERKAVRRFVKSILGRKVDKNTILTFEQFVHVVERFV